MALGPRRQIFHRENQMVALRAGECGGVLSYAMSSGVTVVGYAPDITSQEVFPLGIQIHDVEDMDEGRMYNPWMQRGQRRVSRPGQPVSLSAHCEIDTNFIHPNAHPDSSKKAYLAPSGLITDDASLGGPCIGRFVSSINDEGVAGLPTSQDMIVIYGGGYHRGQYMKKTAPSLFEIQEPSYEFITLQSPGWARIRIRI